jgi:deazaflavin-dependent oxidoreductase (nitroreductase family)
VTTSRPTLRVLWSLHKTLRRLSGGRLGTRAPSDDRIGTLFLHTVGRKSGQLRTNGLFYLDDGPDIIVVASNAGADREPAWWLNLRAQPDAEVEMAGKRRPVRAREATAEEATRLWPRLDAANPDFVTYRAGVTRQIPVVILEAR